jgi:hypothetical protein
VNTSSQILASDFKETDRDLLRPILHALSPATFSENQYTIYAGWKRYTFDKDGVLVSIKLLGQPRPSNVPPPGLIAGKA